MVRIIMHMDLDAFFASAEQREHPEWKGKPVIVGADPKDGKGRGVVSSPSYEARKFGIHSAMPISRAYKLCPTAVFVLPNFNLYIPVSKAVMTILRKFGDKLEQVSIDEAFIDVSSKVKNMKEASVLAEKIKTEILKKEKLTCSIGVATNKLTAKMASDFKKPSGLTVVEPGDEKKFLAPLPVRKLIGVGAKTEIVLKGMNINTIGELAGLSKEMMKKDFGKFGLYLHDAANGIDGSEVDEGKYERKSINRNNTFEKDTKDPKVVFAAIDSMAKSANSSLTAGNFNCKTVGVRLRFEDFETHTKEKTLDKPTTDLDLIKKTIKELVTEFFNDKRKIRLVGIRMTNLETADKKQKKVSEYFN
jgi:DNA polymerase IV (archaeal DinB-like DNA polymerase)